MLENKTVVLGITGGIAAYKSCEIVSRLIKLGAKVEIIMTSNATKFVQPLTFESLTGRQVIVDMFDSPKEWEIEHISLARVADIFVVVPATANFIGKIANGIADDMLTTTYMACKAHKIICPAMNTVMYESQSLLSNLDLIEKQDNITIIKPQVGRLACGDIGQGKLADIDTIMDTIIDSLMPKRDYIGKTILVTAGSTIEDIDRVRFISNYSSGKMGIALAKAAQDRGAKVILIYGNISCDIPKGIQAVSVKSTQNMYDKVMEYLPQADYIIKAAAPADYTVSSYANKIKDNNVSLKLTKTIDIAKAVGEKKADKKLIIFCAETENLISNAKEKLVKKNADMVVANDITKEGAGFQYDTNIVTIVTKDKDKSYDIMPKIDVANIILDNAIEL